MNIGDINKLKAALARYDELDNQRSDQLSELSREAEESGCYRRYDEARTDWADDMDQAGQMLAENIREVLQ